MLVVTNSIKLTLGRFSEFLIPCELIVRLSVKKRSDRRLLFIMLVLEGSDAAKTQVSKRLGFDLTVYKQRYMQSSGRASPTEACNI